MAGGLPHSLQLRDIKYGDKTTDAVRVSAGKQFQAAGRIAEALDLFLLAGADAEVAAIQEQAVKEGRPSLLIAIERRGRPVTAEEWEQAGEGAMKGQRWREAYRCFLRSGDEAALARAQEKIPDYELYLPQGK